MTKSADNKEARFTNAGKEASERQTTKGDPYTDEEQAMIDIALGDGLQNMQIPDHPKVKRSQDDERPLLKIDIVGRNQGKMATFRQDALLQIGLDINNSLDDVIGRYTKVLEGLSQPGDALSPRQKAVSMLKQCLEKRFQ